MTTLERMKDLAPCEGCLGYGETNVGSHRNVDKHGDCNGTGWADGEERLCPECDQNVTPASPHVVYGRAVWHRECIEKAMPDPDAALMLMSSADLDVIAAWISGVERQLDDTLGAMQQERREACSHQLFAARCKVDMVRDRLRSAAEAKR